MKARLFTSVLILSLCFTFKAYSQEKSLEKLKAEADTLYKPYQIDISSNLLTHREVLNVFFAKQVSSYLAGSGSFALSKGYAVLDNGDGRLFVGGTFTNREKIGQKLSFVAQVGLKANVKDNFSTIYTKEKWQNDLGIAGKLTLIGNGSIWMKMEQKKQLMVQRNYILKGLGFEKALQQKITNYERALSGVSADKNFKEKQLKSFYKNIIKEYRNKYLLEEERFIEQGGNYTWSHDYWISAQFYIPFTKSKYDFAPNFASVTSHKETFRPWEFKLSYTNLLTSPKWGKFYLGLNTSLLKNNAVKTKEVKAYDYMQLLYQNGVDTLNVASIDNNSIYVGQYKDFWSYTGGTEIAYFAPGRWSWIGVSGAIEKMWGDYEYVNWKLGVPFSLKNEEGDPKVNFEFQWIEKYKTHSIGISVGIPFSGLIY